MIQVYNPSRLFYTAKDGTCQIKSAAVALGVANNQTVVAAVTGKKIRVLGVQAYTTTGLFNFKNGSGGTALMQSTATAVTDFKLPLSEIGYWETSAATALVTDITVAAVNITVQYIEYTP